jgi:polyisoprenoid-binding protein YceI
MKKLWLGASLLAALVSVPLLAAPATYRIDPEHFSITFRVDHLGYEKLMGMFTRASGEFVYDEQSKQLSSGVVEVQATSVFSNHDGRDDHLRSKDFLDAEKHPVIRFVAKSYEPGGESDGTLRGELTMLGRTHPVEVKVRLNKAAKYPFGHGRHTLGVSARATLQRSHWGMTYGLAPAMVGDQVELMFEFEALKQ